MFCTTLRRCPSYASVLPSLIAAEGLKLRGRCPKLALKTVTYTKHREQARHPRCRNTTTRNSHYHHRKHHYYASAANPPPLAIYGLRCKSRRHPRPHSPLRSSNRWPRPRHRLPPQPTKDFQLHLSQRTHPREQLKRARHSRRPRLRQTPSISPSSTRHHSHPHPSTRISRRLTRPPQETRCRALA